MSRLGAIGGTRFGVAPGGESKPGDVDPWEWGIPWGVFGQVGELGRGENRSTRADDMLSFRLTISRPHSHT